MSSVFRRLVLTIGLLLLCGALSGCIIEDEGGYHHHHGWCWWHPC